MGQELDCPGCRRPLGALSLEQTELRACQSCGGVWLDAGQSERVVGGELTAEERKLAREASRRYRARRRVGGYRALPQVEQGERRCPSCGQGLTPTTVDALGVVTDGCALHGTWFDAGELRVVARWFELRAAGLGEDLARLALLLQQSAKRSRRRSKGG